jgi:2,3-bisphosphoglycerate-dependent phosphoglycerate mutase
MYGVVIFINPNKSISARLHILEELVMATELILIRHGYTVPVNGDYFHAPLTALGQDQAARTGEYFSTPQNHLDGFYSSPLRRAQETAGIMGAKIGQNAVSRPGVEEVRLDELPVLVILEIISITDPVEDYLDARAGGPIRWPVEGRVSAVLLEIVAGHPNQRVAIIAHAGVISAALSWYLPDKRWHWWRTTVSNCSLTRFSVEGNRAQLLGVNETQHLSPVLVTTQAPTKTVEIAKGAHPVEKALVFDKTPDKNN